MGGGEGQLGSIWGRRGGAEGNGEAVSIWEGSLIQSSVSRTQVGGPGGWTVAWGLDFAGGYDVE